jgi:hypothetical protein
VQEGQEKTVHLRYGYVDAATPPVVSGRLSEQALALVWPYRNSSFGEEVLLQKVP